VSVLIVSTSGEDRGLLKQALGVEHWTVRGVLSCEAALNALREKAAGVIVCQSTLPDGTWRDLLHHALEFRAPPRLIVLSRVVDDSLWAEVINLGGYDVLPHPLDAKEVLQVVSMAFRCRSAQRGG